MYFGRTGPPRCASMEGGCELQFRTTKKKGVVGVFIERIAQAFFLRNVIPDFKDKTRYAPYVSFKSQISHIATNKG